LLPDVLAFKLMLLPQVTELGVAVTLVGAVGCAETLFLKLKNNVI
jgi:hypothetical protein